MVYCIHHDKPRDMLSINVIIIGALDLIIRANTFGLCNLLTTDCMHGHVRMKWWDIV